jgi:hypothetical protein
MHDGQCVLVLQKPPGPPLSASLTAKTCQLVAIVAVVAVVSFDHVP